MSPRRYSLTCSLAVDLATHYFGYRVYTRCNRCCHRCGDGCRNGCTCIPSAV